MNYKISIIIPVYNVENYIRTSLNSIINQSIGLKNLEVIMVNDCSTDNSGKIIDEYAQKCENFKAIHLNKNSGAAGKPRNVGLEQAKADYIMFLDPDDCYGVDACKILYNKIKKENVDIVFSRYNYLFANKTTKSPSNFATAGEIKVKSIDEEPDLFTMPPAVWTKIFKRSLIEENNLRFPEEIPAQDFVFVIESFLNADGIILLNNQFLFNYNRIRDSKGDTSISRTKSVKNLSGMAKAYQKTFDILKEHNKTEYFQLIFKIHLDFWVEGFIFNNATNDEKIELLKEINPLFEEFDKFEKVQQRKYLTLLFHKINAKEYDDVIAIADALRTIFLNNSKEINSLEWRLKQKQKQLQEVLPIKGYLKYKSKNIVIRLKTKLLQYKLVRGIKKHIKLLIEIMETYQPWLNYNKMTFILPYRKTDDPDRELNLDITLKYLKKVGIPNILISEHSDKSAKKFLMEEYSTQFKSFKVIHTEANGELFNKSNAINNGVIASNTPYIVILDIDCLTPKKNVNKALSLLEKGYDVVHPFDRRVNDITDKKAFQKKYDFSTVHTHEQKRPWADGGIVFWNKHSFVQIGMKNEYFSGWGGEDNEIMVRANLFNLKQYRINDTLYHLYHHRPQVRTKNNVELLEKAMKKENSKLILKEVNNWPWVIKAKNKFTDEFKN